MNFTIRIALAIILSFLTAMVFAPFVIKAAKRLRAGQNILHWVGNHQEKQGTPTFGGFIFIIPAIISTVILAGFRSRLGFIAVAITLGFMLIGFLDDFIKIRSKKNQGLKAYQKILGQVTASALVTWFSYTNRHIGTSINLPFSGQVIDLGWWFLPLCFIAFIAASNAVNLTDGLDGLAGGTSAVYFGTFTVLLVVKYAILNNQAQLSEAVEVASLAVFSASLAGALLGFLWHNSNPASVFMGDTGALALGAAAAAVAIFSKNPLIILILGIMFVLSCISVIMQVLYFKATKKRVFLMAPLHHHFQYKGIKEQKIVACYIIITLVAGVISLASMVTS